MIDDKVRELAQAANFAAFTTLLPDGSPQTHVMWVDADDEHVLINTEPHRKKFKNVEQNPRVTVTVIDAANPYHYAEVRGQVVDVQRGDRARAHIDELSQKYNNKPYPDDAIQTERVILKIRPDRTQVFGA